MNKEKLIVFKGIKIQGIRAINNNRKIRDVLEMADKPEEKFFFPASASNSISEISLIKYPKPAVPIMLIKNKANRTKLLKKSELLRRKEKYSTPSNGGTTKFHQSLYLRVFFNLPAKDIRKF